MVSVVKTQYFNKRLFLACLLIAVSQFNYGFDNQAFATSQAMDPFIRQFGSYNAKTKKHYFETYWLSLFNSLQLVGFAVGVVLGSFISSTFGRRMCMFSMSCWALVTATIAVTSNTPGQILSARVLNYIYIGMELSVVPVYQSEIVPAEVRGFIVGTYHLSLLLGGLTINGICRATSSLPDNRAWRIPMGLFYIIPTIVLSLIWFIPESPRWLLSQGRTEEARAALQKFRQGSMTEEKIDEEFNAIQKALDNETESGKWKELWQGRVNRKRTFIALGTMFFQEATGQAFASQYGTIFIKSIGSVNPFSMSLVNSALSGVATIVSIFTVDKIGRRPLLLIGACVQFVGLFSMGGLGTISPSTRPVGKGIISMLTIFGVGFGIGWAPLAYVVTTELPALHLRDQTQRTASVVKIITSFVVTFTLPYLLNEPYAGLRSKVGFIFGSLAFCAFIFTYFCVPECAGKSLEEVDFMFHEEVPIRQFGGYKIEEYREKTVKEKREIHMEKSS